MNKLLRVLSISIALLTVSTSQILAQSCSDIFSGGLDASKPILLPGAPAQLQVRAEGGDIKVFKGDELLSTVRREDSAALSVSYMTRWVKQHCRGKVSGLVFKV